MGYSWVATVDTPGEVIRVSADREGDDVITDVQMYRTGKFLVTVNDDRTWSIDPA